MRKRWLLLDAPNLCWRAFHTTGALKWGETQTGTVYGFLRDVKGFMETFVTPHVIFCWDFGEPLRTKIYPEYKGDRKEKYKKMTDLEKIARKAFREQVRCIRSQYLTELGFKNNFYARGYEADDIIAQLCLDLPVRDEIVIISGDHDLYQMLKTGRVRIYHPQPKKAVTEESFRKKWELAPVDWAVVKAIAGCISDNIKGIEGIGEITAAKYLRQEASANQFATIEAAGKLIERNGRLVRLPFPDTPSYDIRKDCITPKKWAALADRLGMSSIRDWR